MNLVASIFTTLFIAILVTTYDGPLNRNEPNEILKVVTKSIISLLLLIFLVLYIFTLSILISHLKKEYKSFYLQQRCKMLTCAISLIITLSAKIILRMLEYNDKFSIWLTNSYANKDISFSLFIFLSSYIEYFAIYASILISLKNNVAPSKTALIIASNSGDQHDLRFNSQRTSLVESLTGDDDDDSSSKINTYQG